MLSPPVNTRPTEPPSETPRERARLHPQDRELIERVLARHPQLTARQAIADLRNAGAL